MDSQGGEWADCIKPLFTTSVDVESHEPRTGQIRYLYRQRVSESLVRVVFGDETSLLITKKHKIFTEKGWASIENGLLEKSGMAYRSHGECVRISSVFPVYHNGFVYDLEVFNYHNYIANDVLTHNTCSAIGAIEQIKRERSSIRRAIVITKGDRAIQNFTNELIFKCTSREYVPDNYDELESRKRKIRVKKKINSFYTFKTYISFANELETMSDEKITEKFSNCIFVIDEIHNVRIQLKDSVYEQMHRLLHLSTNSKTILLSGTPMVDSPAEIASVANLILPMDEQLPIEDAFLAEFFEGDELSERGKERLYNALRGRVSFLRSLESEIKRNYIGKSIGKLHLLKVNKLKMSEFQSEAYERALTSNDKEDFIYRNASDASLFVYPDGSWGKSGYTKYMKGDKMSDELKKVLRGSTQEETLKNIKKFSVTYYNAISYILENPTKLGFCFITSVHGSGSILFSKLLDLVGFKEGTKNIASKGRRYLLFREETSSNFMINSLAKFNANENMNGDYVQLIIGGAIVKEGFTFKNIQFEFILTPDFNYTGVSQALARGIRLNSHKALLEAGVPDVKVDIFQNVSMPRDKELLSIDLHKYEISEAKDIKINNIIRLIMESSFDCALNYNRNRISNNAFDNSRECNYTQCSYDCKGIDMDMIQTQLKADQIDYSTYQLYYSNPRIPDIYNKILKLITKHNKIQVASIVESLKAEYTEGEVRNALMNALDYSRDTLPAVILSDMISQRTSNIQKIIAHVQSIFKTRFSIRYDELRASINTEEYTDYELLAGLSTIVDDNIFIKNKYGFDMFLRESMNVYFLSKDITSVDIDTYYSKNLLVSNTMSNEEILSLISANSTRLVLQALLSQTGESTKTLIVQLPIELRSALLEQAVIANLQGVDRNSKLRQSIIDWGASYLTQQADGTYVCSINRDRVRCLKEGADSWEECNVNVAKLDKEYAQEVMKKADDGIIGKYNSANDKFCLVTVEADENGGDTRKIKTGQVCATMHKDKLIELVISRLKLEPPSGDKFPNAKMDDYEGLPPYVNENNLHSYLSWGKYAVKVICSLVRAHLESKELVIPDADCGNAGKTKNVEKKESESAVYVVITYNPTVANDSNKEYAKQIKEIMRELNPSFKLGKDGEWKLSYRKKKVIGVLQMIEGRIAQIYVAEGYRKRKADKDGMMALLKTVPNKEIILSNTTTYYTKLKKYLETSLGYKTKSDDGTKTVLTL